MMKIYDSAFILNPVPCQALQNIQKKERLGSCSLEAYGPVGEVTLKKQMAQIPKFKC